MISGESDIQPPLFEIQGMERSLEGRKSKNLLENSLGSVLTDKFSGVQYLVWDNNCIPNYLTPPGFEPKVCRLLVKRSMTTTLVLPSSPIRLSGLVN